MLSLLEADAQIHREIEAPFHGDGIWWLSVEIDGEPFDVSWRASAGFGLYQKSPEFGGRPDEICTDAALFARRLLQLAAARRVGGNRYAPSLRDVRHLYAVSQVELAGILGVDQAFVSRLERRADLKVSTLREYVAALGGQLEVGVRFPDYAAPLAASLNCDGTNAT